MKNSVSLAAIARPCSALLALGALALAGAIAPAPAQAADPAPAAPQAAASATAPSPQEAAAAQAKMKEEMDAYNKLMQPGEHHKRLGSVIGKWKLTGKTWTSADQPPMEVNSTMEASWILNGRYVQELHKGSFMGQPFEGRSIDGYDNIRKEYFSTWIDNMGTGVEVYHGTCEDPCSALTQIADSMDPMTGKKIRTRQVTTYIDADTFRMEMYVMGAGKDGKDEKIMEMVGKRDRS